MAVKTSHDEAAVGILAADAVLDPWPIPAERITQRPAPDARGMVFSRSEDARLLRGVWRCAPPGTIHLALRLG